MVAPRSRTKKDLRRRKHRRESYDRILVVCEGTRTEFNYFSGLVDDYRLSTVNVKVKGLGKDPRALVHEAINLQRQEQQLDEEYDTIYCVFDRDRHHHFESASEKARNSGINLARSWPCFEYWLLLHFEYSRRLYQDASKTACENCVRDLKKFLPDYEKNTVGLFGKLIDLLDNAKQYARRALQEAKATGNPNPSTEVHLLVEYLQSLRAKDAH